MRYEIKGDTLPVVICHLEDGEQMITEGGAMSWMSPNMQMATTTNGGLGKAFGSMFSGEKMFQNVYTAKGNGMIAFASCFPGSIRAFESGPVSYTHLDVYKRQVQQRCRIWCSRLRKRQMKRQWTDRLEPRRRKVWIMLSSWAAARRENSQARRWSSGFSPHTII